MPRHVQGHTRLQSYFPWPSGPSTALVGLLPGGQVLPSGGPGTGLVTSVKCSGTLQGPGSPLLSNQEPRPPCSEGLLSPSDPSTQATSPPTKPVPGLRKPLAAASWALLLLAPAGLTPLSEPPRPWPRAERHEPPPLGVTSFLRLLSPLVGEMLNSLIEFPGLSLPSLMVKLTSELHCEVCPTESPMPAPVLGTLSGVPPFPGDSGTLQVLLFP